MVAGDVRAGLRAEVDALGAVLLALDEPCFGRATRCPPWSVAELVAHVTVACSRLPDMLAGPAPEGAEVTAAEYFRPDARFGPAAESVRVAIARRDAAASASGHALAEAFVRQAQEMVSVAEGAPVRRVVVTRWGDAMTLAAFLATRVVEVAVHGLDLSAALGREPWLTPEGAAVVTEVLLGETGPALARRLGWGTVTLVDKATGRQPLSPPEVGLLSGAGAQLLTFG